MGTPQSRKKVLETVSCSPEGVIPRGGVEGAGLGLVQNAEEQWAGGAERGANTIGMYAQL